MSLEGSLKEHLKLQPIPLEVVNILMSNHFGKKRSLMEGAQLKLQRKTKDALDTIKRMNNLQSLSDAVDLLITTVSLYQLHDMEDLSKVQLYDKDMLKDVKYNGHTREVNINGRSFYSIASVAKQYKCSRQTVNNRIKSMAYRWRKWNFADEDVDIKYDSRRVAV